MENTPKKTEEVITKAPNNTKRNLIIGIIVALILIIGGVSFAAVRNSSNNIDGTWRNAKIEQDTIEVAMEELESQLSEFNFDQTFMQAKFTMVVKERKAVFALDITYDGSGLAKQVLDSAYNEMLKSIEQETKSSGLKVEEVLTTIYGANYEATLKAMLPTQAELEKEFYDSQAEFAKELNGSYNADAKTLSLVFYEADVDPLFGTLTITSVNDTAFKQLLQTSDVSVNDLILYSRSGNVVNMSDDEYGKFTLVE